MSKKIYPKTPKKKAQPKKADPSRAPARSLKFIGDDIAWLKQRMDTHAMRLQEHDELIELHRSNTGTAFRNTGARNEEQDKRLTALESRLPSAPEEDQKIEPWVPKVGEYYTATKDLGWYKEGRTYLYDHHAGRSTEHLAMCERPGSSVTFSPEHHCTILRPATPEEITTYKEEQQRKEEDRLQAEREAAEAAKPIAKGTPVKFRDGREGEYLSAYTGTYCGAERTMHWLLLHRAQLGLGWEWDTIQSERSSFTITSPT